MKQEQFREKIRTAINCASAENGSNTPDFILAEYLTDCLAAFDKASRSREKWYGKSLSIGGITEPEEAEEKETKKMDIDHDFGAVMQAVARGWCHPKNSCKVMDEDLAIAITKEVMKILPSPDPRGECWR